jgi:hypothetical protein
MYRSMHFYFFFLVFKILFCGQMVLAMDLNPQEYLAIKSIAEEIQNRWPSSEHIYVGVGRSPTAVLTYLEIAHNAQTVYLPFSKPSFTEKSLVQMKDRSPKDVANILRVLDKHFFQFLVKPFPGILEKRYLLIDYVVNGSFQSAIRLIGKFFRRGHFNVELDYVAITNRESSMNMQSWLPPNHVISLDNRPKEFERLLQFSHYDRISPAGEWLLSASNPEFTRTSLSPDQEKEYQNYRQQMDFCISRDRLIRTNQAHGCHEVFNFED